MANTVKNGTVKRKSFIRRTFDHMIEARERQARTVVNAYLRNMNNFK